MNTTLKFVLTAIISLGIGAGGAIAFTMGDVDVKDPTAMQHMVGADTMAMGDEMSSMTAALQGKTGDEFDQAFLSGMIVHHQGAVVMAQEALKNAKHQEIKDLAQNIITAQNKEIKEMQTWQTAWYGSTTSSLSR